MCGFTAHARFSSCRRTSARQGPETTLTSVVNLSLHLTTPRSFIFHRRKRIYLMRRSAGASGATAQSPELVIFQNPGGCNAHLMTIVFTGQQSPPPSLTFSPKTKALFVFQNLYSLINPGVKSRGGPAVTPGPIKVWPSTGRPRSHFLAAESRLVSAHSKKNF